MPFKPVLPAIELRRGERKCLTLGALNLLLVNCDGEIRAYQNRCPHRGGRLSEGAFDGRRLVCSWHEWSFDAQSGQGINPESVRLKDYPLRIEDGMIFVECDDTPAGTEVVESLGALLPAAAGPASTEERAAFEDVGPVLTAGQESWAVLRAIGEANEGTRLIDRASYLRVLVPRRCRLPVENVQKHLGRPFHLPSDLEKIMSSFRGRFSFSATEAVWEYRESKR